MFHIKICGVRRNEDVEAVWRSGADAIGMNFFPPSTRYLDPDAEGSVQLSRLAAECGLLRVGVFVNATAAKIESVVTALDIDLLQLHGDESIAFAQSLMRATGLGVVRAIKLPTGPMDPDVIERAARPWMKVGCHPLLDADAGAAHGGSGKWLDWESIRRWSEQQIDDVAGTTPFTLAGGLTPENVREAIEVSGARSVDVASGVEQPRGRKDPERITRFVAACRTAGL